MPTTAKLLCLLAFMPFAVNSVAINTHDCPTRERWNSDLGHCVPCPQVPVGDFQASKHHEDNCKKYPSCCSSKIATAQERKPAGPQTTTDSGAKNHSDITDGGSGSTGGKNKSAANGDISRTGGSRLSASLLSSLIVCGVLVILLPAVAFTSLTLITLRAQQPPEDGVPYQEVRARDEENQGGEASSGQDADSGAGGRSNGNLSERPLPQTPQSAAIGVEDNGQSGQLNEDVSHAGSSGSSGVDVVTNHLDLQSPVYAGSSTYDSIGTYLSTRPM